MNKYLSILIGSAALGLASCSKDTVPEEVNWAPKVSNEEVNILNRHSVELSGAVLPAEGQITAWACTGALPGSP